MEPSTAQALGDVLDQLDAGIGTIEDQLRVYRDLREQRRNQQENGNDHA